MSSIQVSFDASGLTALVLAHKDENGQSFDTWQFVLQSVEARSTRLIHRVRGGPMGALDMLQFDYFIMQRRIVLGSKQRAEAVAIAEL
jgi:hypothetical protein